LWLADSAAPAIAEAATTVAHMVAATRRLGAEEQALLDAARNALARPAMAPGPIRTFISGKRETDTFVLRPLGLIAGAVERLRGDVGFCVHDGTEVRHALSQGTLRRYVAAEPAGCCAVNLALLGRNAPPAGTPVSVLQKGRTRPAAFLS
jgi:hypothetical protein